MTVQEAPTEVQYEGNGTTTVYAFPFQMLDESHIRCTVDGVILDPSDYTVTLNPDGIGGEVEFDVAPADGVEIFINRATPDTQLSSYPPYSPMPAEVVELGLDKLTMISQELVTASGLTGEEIEILRALFEAIEIAVTQNSEDIASLDIRVTTNETGISNLVVRVNSLEGNEANWINKDGSVAMEGQLRVLFSPEGDLDAVSNVFMRTYTTALIEGLILLGFFDASLNANPPNATETGEFWIIARGGTLNVSDGIDPPTPTLVNVGDYIIWLTPNNIWVHIPRLIASAAGVSFNPTGTEITSTNVQDALVEVDGFLVHRTGNISESIDGNKFFTGPVAMEAFLAIRNEQPLVFNIDGDTNQGANGVTRMIKILNGQWLIQQRILGTWETIASVDVDSDVMAFNQPPTTPVDPVDPDDLTRMEWVESLFDDLPNQFVDVTTLQEGIGGVKGWADDQSVDNTTAYYWRGTGAGGNSGTNNASGTLRIMTQGGDRTVFNKRNTDGDAWVDVVAIDVAGNSIYSTAVIIEDQLRIINDIPQVFNNADENPAALGAYRISNNSVNTWSLQWHDGAGLEDRHRVFEDGSQQFDGVCTFNDGLATTTVNCSGTSTFTGIATFVAVPICTTPATTPNQLTNKATVDAHANTNHRATEALALQASVDNANQIFYADQGS